MLEVAPWSRTRDYGCDPRWVTRSYRATYLVCSHGPNSSLTVRRYNHSIKPVTLSGVVRPELPSRHRFTPHRKGL